MDHSSYTSEKAFLFENVTGLLSAKNGKGEKIIDLLKNAFRDIGYTLTTQVVNAADYGVPQRRKRVIIVGVKGESRFSFPKATHNESGVGLKKYVSVEEALDDLPKVIYDENGSADYLEMPKTEYQKRMRNVEKVTEHFMRVKSQQIWNWQVWQQYWLKCRMAHWLMERKYVILLQEAEI